MICYWGFLNLDFVNCNFYESVKRYGKKTSISYIVDYLKWTENPYVIYNYIRTQLMLNLGSFYFLITFLYFLFAS
jgi:hypothetical protein